LIVAVQSENAKFSPLIKTGVPPDVGAFVGCTALEMGESNENPT
jgi:hypothetical protein